ncbi:hypothetical protein EV368DRAFT_88913 [Lentinula lateritia]|nr:hypothetical protein EV368DRAFT_88913 [Lentinula lateritia]
MGRYAPDTKVFGIPLLERHVTSTPEFEMMAPSTNGDVVLQYLSAAFLLGERVAELVPSRVVYVNTNEGATPCVVLAVDKYHKNLRRGTDVLNIPKLSGSRITAVTSTMFGLLLCYEIAICFGQRNSTVDNDILLSSRAVLIANF